MFEIQFRVCHIQKQKLFPSGLLTQNCEFESFWNLKASKNLWKSLKSAKLTVMHFKVFKFCTFTNHKIGSSPKFFHFLECEVTIAQLQSWTTQIILIIWNSQAHYSKSQFFVQKFNFGKTSTFSWVFHPNFFDNFSCEIKAVNSLEVQNHNIFTSFSPPKINNFLEKSKLIFWTKYEDFEQCVKDVSVLKLW